MLKVLLFWCVFLINISYALDMGPFRVGAALEILIPTKLPQFEKQILSYGISMNLPFSIGEFQVEGKYGGTETFALRLLEFLYRIPVGSPYVNVYLEGGAHYLSYSVSGEDFSNFGPLIGWGINFSLFQSSVMYVGIRTLMHGKIMTCFGGGFVTAL